MLWELIHLKIALLLLKRWRVVSMKTLGRQVDLVRKFIVRQIKYLPARLTQKFSWGLFKVNLCQKFRKRSECGKLKLNGLHRDHPSVWATSNPTSMGANEKWFLNEKVIFMISICILVLRIFLKIFPRSLNSFKTEPQPAGDSQGAAKIRDLRNSFVSYFNS